MRPAKLLFLFIIGLSMVPLVQAFHIEHHYPFEYNVSYGTGAGAVNNSWAIDGFYWTFNETNTTPGFQYNFNISVPDQTTSIPLYLSFYEWYSGNPAHIINVQYLDQLSSSWVTLGQLVDGAGLDYTNFSLVTLSHGQLFSNNIAQFRVVHTSPGNTAHFELVDYITLEAVNKDVPTLSPWDINWLTLVFFMFLVLIGFVLRKPEFTVFSGIVGIVLGLFLMSTSVIIGAIVLCLGVYLVFEGTND